MRTVICAMESGTYVPPNKLTLGQWLDTWAEQYIGNVKDSTSAAYKASIRTHIKPKLGAVRLDALTTHMIQTFYNGLLESAEDRRAVSAKTVKNIHGILHKALRQDVANGYGLAPFFTSHLYDQGGKSCKLSAHTVMKSFPARKAVPAK